MTSPKRLPSGRPAAVGLLAMLCLFPGHRADAAIGEWVDGDHSRIRLVAAGVSGDGNLSAGIEVELDPGWHTYWRSPGDAGIPPSFNFEGSINVDQPLVAYPVPLRLDDGITVSNIYEDYVLFPLTARADSTTHPIELIVKLDMGVCAEVCVPAHFEARLTVPPTETDLAASRLIAAARAIVPAPPDSAAAQPVEGAVRSGGTDKRPVFEITTTLPDPKAATVFVEGPSDWYGGPPQLVSASGGKAVYRVEFDRLTAKTPIAGSRLIVTVVAGGKAVEQSVSLD
jgi:suppressor for copper-sensitivity B